MNRQVNRWTTQLVWLGVVAQVSLVVICAMALPTGWPEWINGLLGFWLTVTYSFVCCLLFDLRINGADAILITQRREKVLREVIWLLAQLYHKHKTVWTQAPLEVQEDMESLLIQASEKMHESELWSHSFFHSK
jgi:hypothetical protein